jgi:hypothetical protein
MKFDDCNYCGQPYSGNSTCPVCRIVQALLDDTCAHDSDKELASPESVARLMAALTDEELS